MEEKQNILLNSLINKKAVNENSSLNININGSKLLLPEDPISDTLDAYEVYMDERKKSNKFRLVVNINPFCSNVLFNPYTEIVKDEGSKDVVCLNFLDDSNRTSDSINHIINKSSEGKYIIAKTSDFVWTPYEAIRDTQLSSERFGFDYHCGIDIFNNHIIRNKVLRAVNYHHKNSIRDISQFSNVYGFNYVVPVNAGNNGRGTPHKYVSNDFNTIDDYMRDSNGVIISENVVRLYQGVSDGEYRQDQLPLHLYQDVDIMSFEECVENKLIDDNGWYGFKNPSINASVKLDKTENDYGKCINRTINNKEIGEFIDMYPGRDLYSFTPKYNKFRKRIEKNWNYCITYPSKNVITMDNGTEFPFFRYTESHDDPCRYFNPKIEYNGSNVQSIGNRSAVDVNTKIDVSLKVYMFDEGTIDDNGESLLTIYTICQHGLMVGDTVNIYKSDELFYDSVQVVNIVDNFIFQVHKDATNMSENWIKVTDRNVKCDNAHDEGCIDNPTEELPTPQKVMNGILQAGDKHYPICESNRCNIDPNAQDIYIKRVINGVECKYYVRKFSRLPNFKFKDREINDYTLYKEDSDLIKIFSNPEDKRSEFESHIAKLGFANTAYGDDTTEIVFTDDIDTSYVNDNLGRPLSELFLTIVKNNKGYKKWYGIGENVNVNDEEVEYSHCFGKIHGSFALSDYYREWCHNGLSSNLYDVRDLTYESIKGFIDDESNDEIEFDKDYEYYGDICCYSPIDCDEQVLQMSMHRFNTVQRELSNIESNPTSLNKFKCGRNNVGTLCHDEIKDDENSITVFFKENFIDPFNAFSGIGDDKLYHSSAMTFSNMTNFKEGYYYQPHYRIPIKTVSKTLNTEKAIEYEVYSISSNEIRTVVENEFSKNEKLLLYNRSTNEVYNVIVTRPIDFNRFECDIVNGSSLIFENVNDYVLLKKPDYVPEYAKIMKDGSCRYGWRNIVSNGIEENTNIYPFTNGAFYIKRSFNFFLRRQDPTKEYLGKVSDSAFDYVPKGEDINDYPNFSMSDKINYDENEFDPC